MKGQVKDWGAHEVLAIAHQVLRKTILGDGPAFVRRNSSHYQIWLFGGRRPAMYAYLQDSGEWLFMERMR
jgi:hypothetical protein